MHHSCIIAEVRRSTETICKFDSQDAVSLFLSALPSLATSLAHTSHLFHPSILPPSRLLTPAPSTPSESCPNGRLIFSHFSLQIPNDVSLIRDLHDLEADLPKPRTISSIMAYLNRSPPSPRESWSGKRCDRRRTFTSKEPKRSRCTGLSSSRTGGRKATTRRGWHCCLSTEARLPSAVLQDVRRKKGFPAHRECGMISGR